MKNFLYLLLLSLVTAGGLFWIEKSENNRTDISQHNVSPQKLNESPTSPLGASNQEPPVHETPANGLHNADLV
jgi:hypothetical protein